MRLLRSCSEFTSTRPESNRSSHLQEFLTAIQQRFSLIDVKKNQRETKKDSKRGKEPLLGLHNEIKIITGSDEVFALWSELIARGAAGPRDLREDEAELQMGSAKGRNPEQGVLQVAREL